jgi:GxxExxY protein
LPGSNKDGARQKPPRFANRYLDIYPDIGSAKNKCPKGLMIRGRQVAATLSSLVGGKKRPFMSVQEDIDQLTYKINGAIFEVNRVLGAGFLEKVYENALVLELRRQGLKAESQVPISVLYKDEIVGEYMADILVEDRIILELKAVEQLQKVYEAQIINYLKATGIKVGILVNFKHPKADIKRFVL